MKDNLISIIISTYNRAHVIIETLESISKQTHENWKCIIVYDGSNVGNKNLINDYVL
ncbi:glycosyltransferase [Nonlabens sp. Asnod3-A02]|uniref:glycosyltransferase n=1 Tax=Nonlabens sp. Asnod3-A02 TaxID=3160579 RepID=UPI0038634E3D